MNFFKSYAIFLMRLSVVIGCISVCCSGVLVASVSNGQKLTNTNIQLTSQTSLVQALKEIEKKTDFLFAYQTAVIEKYDHVKLTAGKRTVAQTLNILLAKTPLTYSQEGKYVTILPWASPEPKSERNSVRQQTVHGQVTDSEGAPLVGVTIRVLNTSRGTTTDENGMFAIQADASDELSITYMGYKPQVIAVKDQLEIAVRMVTEGFKDLEEVVVVGYGTQRKSDLTGAVGTVDVGKVLNSRPVTNVQELLAGAVPGLNVSKSSGAVGSGASINIRGTSTIGGSSGVLVLIDGVPGNLYTLNPNDIERISTLKDAASAAIYGSRAANGVLLVTTKRAAKSDKPVIEVNSSVGLQNPQFMVDFVGASDFMRLWDEALVNDGKEPVYGEQGLADLRSGKYADNRWYRDIYRENAAITNHNLAISGSEKAVDYRLAASYDYQDGTLPLNNYHRVIVRPDIQIRLSDKLRTRANIQYTETYIREPNGGTTNWQANAARVSPLDHITNANGQYGVGSAMAGNPIAAVNNGGFQRQKHKEMMAIFDLTYQPMDNLEFQGMFSRTTHDNWVKNRALTYSLFDMEGNLASRQNIVTNLMETNGTNFRNLLQLTGTYDLNVSEHQARFLAGYSQEYYQTTTVSAFRDRLPFPAIDVLNTGSSANMQNNGTAGDVAIQSVFGRVNYSYDDRYLFQANIRADGSSRFAKGNRWGVFPSFSAGWNIHNESFFDVPWLSQLKLRGSWGILGDAEKVGYYATAQVLTYNPSMYGFNGNVVPGAYNNVAVNPNISWEQAKQTNIGIDLSFLQQRIHVNAEYFINDRDKILYAPPAPTEFGLTAPLSNLLRLRNSGFELSAGYQDRANDYRWSFDANMSYARNEVMDLAGTGPWIEGNSITDVGMQLGLPYGLQAIGLFENDADVENSPDQGANVFAGNIKYKDQDSNNLIDGDDRVILNDKPVVRYGANLTFGWKQFDVAASIYGALHAYRYIQSYEGWAFYLSQNARPMHLDRWTPDNPNGSYPRLTIQYTSNDTRYSDYWLRRADYLKIQNVQLGYTFAPAALNRLNIQQVRLFLSGQNLATITNYPGFDPEGGYYPLSRTYSIGFNLKF